MTLEPPSSKSKNDTGKKGIELYWQSSFAKKYYGMRRIIFKQLNRHYLNKSTMLAVLRITRKKGLLGSADAFRFKTNHASSHWPFGEAFRLKEVHLQP